MPQLGGLGVCRLAEILLDLAIPTMVWPVKVYGEDSNPRQSQSHLSWKGWLRFRELDTTRKSNVIGCIEKVEGRRSTHTRFYPRRGPTPVRITS